MVKCECDEFFILYSYCESTTDYSTKRVISRIPMANNDWYFWTLFLTAVTVLWSDSGEWSNINRVTFGKMNGQLVHI